MEEKKNQVILITNYMNSNDNNLIKWEGIKYADMSGYYERKKEIDRQFIEFMTENYKDNQRRKRIRDLKKYGLIFFLLVLFFIIKVY